MDFKHQDKPQNSGTTSSLFCTTLFFFFHLDTSKRRHRWSANITSPPGLPTVPPPFLPLQHTAVNVGAGPKPGGGVSGESDDVIRGWREGGRAAESVRVPA
jgi:hypothetical protein